MALADQPAPYSPPSYKRPSYSEPAYPDTEPAYEYAYAAKDDYSGVDFSQNEARNAYSTSGEYRVVLPDGRTQIVTYGTADAYSGNVADVKYEGYATYPKYEPKPAYKPAPAYQPAPAYKPAPAYQA